MEEKETSSTWRPGAGARILSWTVGNETPGTSTRETVMPETVMEEKEMSGTWRPGTGVGILSGTVGDERR